MINANLIEPVLDAMTLSIAANENTQPDFTVFYEEEDDGNDARR